MSNIPFYAFNDDGEQVYDYETSTDEFEDDDEPLEIAIKHSRYVVAIYELDRHCGGNEEGGWWYNTGELVRAVKIFRDKDKAHAYVRRANHWLDKVSKAGGYRADLSSMAYQGGAYQARAFGTNAPPSWSDYQSWE